jgi:hypothetical protein
MTSTGADKMIVEGINFNASTDYTYTKPKVNASGGKSIGITNKDTMKGLYLSTPLMLTWGVNSFTDDKTGNTTYDMSLQFPKEEYNTPVVEKFLENMKAFEAKLKADALTNSKDWMNKQKMSSEVIDALWTPMLKYPKDKETGEFDYSRPPTLRVKMQLWDGVWKCELYDMEQKQIFPNENGLFPPDLIAKATNVATVIQCGGLWFANGKFGVTWRFVQAVVKPKQSLMGRCYINLSTDEKDTLSKRAPGDDAEDDDDDDDDAVVNTVQTVDSSDDETPAEEVVKVVAAAVEEVVPQPEPPKKKVVRKKKDAE